jgi:hypothetical protein
MNARPVRLILLVLLTIVAAQAGVLDNINAYTNGGGSGAIDTPAPGWTLIILLFDSNGAVTDISSHNEVTNIDLSAGGLNRSYLGSTSSDSYYADEPLGTLDRVETPELQQAPTGVPEPSTFVLLGLGAAALISYRRR